jgi:hypothetical protein
MGVKCTHLGWVNSGTHRFKMILTENQRIGPHIHFVVLIEAFPNLPLGIIFPIGDITFQLKFNMIRHRYDEQYRD